MTTPTRLLRAATAWAARSQHGSRRNAMVACTALAERRREREDVEEFLAGLARPARMSA